MHPEHTTHQIADSNNPTRRRVRSLLGLPDQAAAMQGHGPLPPGAFHYQRQTYLEEPLRPAPFSRHPADHPHGSTDELLTMDAAEEATSATTSGDAAQIENQMDTQADADVGRTTQQPTIRNKSSLPIHEERPIPTTAPIRERPLPEPGAGPVQPPAIGQTDQAVHPQVQMPDQAAGKPAQDTAEIGKQTTTENSPAAGWQIRYAHGSRQEIAIPGRSTVRQVFAALAAAADSEGRPAPDQSPALAQQPAPQSTGQPQMESRTDEHNTQSGLRQCRTASVPPPADQQALPTSRPSTTADQLTGSAPQIRQTKRAAAAQTVSPAPMQGDQLAADRTEKNSEYGSKTKVVTDTQETQTPLVSPQGQAHSAAQAQVGAVTETRNTSITPARQSNGDGVRQIEELRRTFYELVSKKTSANGPKVNEPTNAAETETPLPPPLQQVVVINRSSGNRGRSRLPHAFWERSGMARTTLKMIR